MKVTASETIWCGIWTDMIVLKICMYLFLCMGVCVSVDFGLTRFLILSCHHRNTVFFGILFSVSHSSSICFSCKKSRSIESSKLQLQAKWYSLRQKKSGKKTSHVISRIPRDYKSIKWNTYSLLWVTNQFRRMQIILIDTGRTWIAISEI